MSAAHHELAPFITLFSFQEDKQRAGRVLSTVKIGDVYMSRLVIAPGVVARNFYHQQTKVMFYVETGLVQAGFEQIETKERKVQVLMPGKYVVHVFPSTAYGLKNIGTIPAVVVFFTSNRLRSEDEFYYTVLS